MSEIIIFTSPTCTRCEVLKKRIPKDMKYTLVDATLHENEVIVLMNDAYHAVRKELPVLVVDGELFIGLQASVDKIKSLTGKD